MVKIIFSGNYKHQLDHKGRVAIPTSFRKALPQESNGKLALNIGFDQAIIVTPWSIWEKVLGATLSSLSHGIEDSQLLTFWLAGNVKCLELDNQGRITIPKELLEYAGINKDVMFVGDVYRFYIMSPQVFSDYWKRSEAKQKEIFANLLSNKTIGELLADDSEA